MIPIALLKEFDTYMRRCGKVEIYTMQNKFSNCFVREARWPSGRASDTGARGRGFDPNSGHRVVSLSKIHLPLKSTGGTQEAEASFRHD